MLFNWYDDTMRIERVTKQKVGNITKSVREVIKDNVECRIYQAGATSPIISQGETLVTDQKKVACDIEVDVKSGDFLYIKKYGIEPEVKYVAGTIDNKYDPVGNNATGLEHKEITLTTTGIA